jgi:hypothetical protein
VAEQLVVEGEFRQSDLSLPPDHAFKPREDVGERRISCKARALLSDSGAPFRYIFGSSQSSRKWLVRDKTRSEFCIT